MGGGRGPGGPGGPGGGGGGRGFPGGGGGGGGFGGGGNAGGRYNLTFSLNFNNILNHANLANPVGNLGSRCLANRLTLLALVVSVAVTLRTNAASTRRFGLASSFN